MCYPNPKFTVIHNRANVEIVLFRITLPICGCQGPLWSTLPLSIFFIIINNHRLAFYPALLIDHIVICEQLLRTVINPYLKILINSACPFA